MKYRALRDSFSTNRHPNYCVAGRVYNFEKNPGKHFESLEKAPKKERKTALIEEAASLGMEIDKRKSAETIAAELQAAKTVEDDGEQ